VVVKLGHRGGYGNMVLLKHADGYFTRYAHLARVDVALGQSVKAGDAVGVVGDTGHATAPHLHFEILAPDRRPLNPEPFLFRKS
jgi:murein DD-endopeptidase MepM/ murein hydrolase activator NlpD